jgi:general secretion pathway protein C
MERFIHRNLWLLLSGAVILIAAPVAARTMDLFSDLKLTRFIPGLAPERTRSPTPEGPPIIIERERIIIPATRHHVVRDEEGPRSALATQAPLAAPRDGIRAVGEHAYEVPSADVRDAFSHWEEQATQVRVVPAFRDGQARGFKLFAIRPGSLYAKLGLQNGDVIQRVNGMSLKTPQSALAAFESLREARHVEVDLERGGTMIHKVYDVR